MFERYKLVRNLARAKRIIVAAIESARKNSNVTFAYRVVVTIEYPNDTGMLVFQQKPVYLLDFDIFVLELVFNEDMNGYIRLKEVGDDITFYTLGDIQRMYAQPKYSFFGKQFIGRSICNDVNVGIESNDDIMIFNIYCRYRWTNAWIPRELSERSKLV